MSMDVVFKLYKVALKTPLLHLEDVFTTGVCAKHANITHQHHLGLAELLSPKDRLTLKIVQSSNTSNDDDE